MARPTALEWFGRTAMPVDLPVRRGMRPAPRVPPPTLLSDVLDGLAVAFCILLVGWGTQHIIFDYIASPNWSADRLWSFMQGVDAVIVTIAETRI